MSAPAPAPGSRAVELARFLEVQNLGLNLPFALGFLVVASGGSPSWRALALVVVAFVAARNAGHSFNRWADRELDARNPRTRGRALVTGTFSPNFALGSAALNAAILVGAAFLLNPLALLLVPVALGLVLGYSYTKRVSALTTVFLGLVEAITPGAVYVAIQGALPTPAFVAALALGCWGTAFETIHSVGDMASDRAAGTFSLPLAIGLPRSLQIVPLLHVAALGLLFGYGWLSGLASEYGIALLVMGVGTALVDVAFWRDPSATRRLFRAHFGLSAVFLAGVILAYVH